MIIMCCDGLVVVTGCALLCLSAGCENRDGSVTVPFVLDHNRMLVEAEMQRPDGSWRPALLWVDTGGIDFFVSPPLAGDLGIDLEAAAQQAERGQFTAPPPAGVRIGGMALDYTDVPSKVVFEPRWLFDTMHNDANLPATVLRRYRVVFDYPERRLTIARPGAREPGGERVPAAVHPQTGIVQIDAQIGDEPFSFALDSGASYSFTSEEIVTRLAGQHPDWSHCTGAVACANIWGYWPGEAAWPVVRVPEIRAGGVRLDGVGLAGLPNFLGGATVGTWYSQKAARPVDGFLGPNALKAFRVEIDYANSAVYFEKGADPDVPDMDLVALTLRLDADGTYRVLGVAARDGNPLAEGIEPGDALLEIGDLKTTGATMGTVVDALRGSPGALRVLVLERGGERVRVEARVTHVL